MAHAQVFIIGAGLAGLACADALSAADIAFRVVDKGRGPGGRCSSRRSPVGRFDHGAPFFRTTSPAFAARVDSWRTAGLAAELSLPDGQVHLGTPAMNSFLRHEAERLGAEFGVEIASPRPAAGGWQLLTTAGHPVGEADWVVFAAPAPQSSQLLPQGSLRDAAASAIYAPTWTLMAGFDRDVPMPADPVLSVPDGPIAQVIVQNRLPGRDPGGRLVAHARHDWSEARLELDRESVADELMDIARNSIADFPATAHLDAHRWRYARVVQPVGSSFGLDTRARLATCGDWHLGPDCEHAWLSGRALGEELTRALG